MDRLTEKAPGCFQYSLKDHKSVPGEFGTYDAFYDYSMAVKKLGAYEDAEQAGQLVIFPCKVGEIVWLIDTRFFQRDKSRLPLVRCRVNEFSNDGKHTYMVLDGAERWYAMRRFRAVLIEDFGHIVFRTRDEATAALDKDNDVLCKKDV